MRHVGTQCGPKYRIWAHLRGTPTCHVVPLTSFKKMKSFNFSSFIQEAGPGVKCGMWGPSVVLNTEYGPICEVRQLVKCFHSTDRG